jgi:hypothetical protein
MASRKQRRRRDKERRHEYDLVEIDAEGNETVVTASDEREPARPAAKRSPRSPAPAAKQGRGAARPPSWSRVAKRAGIFAPIFLATVLLLGGDRMTFAGAVVQTVMLMAIFVPFSYFMDRLVWRSQQKRLARSKGA